MLGSLRSIIHSRIGALIALVFLGLIALAFAGADITGSRFGGVAGGDRVATIGGARIGTADLGKAMTNAFEGERQQNPQLTMKDFVAAGALDEVLTGLVDRTAMMEWGQTHGMAVSDRLVDSEIVKIPAFQGPDGKFNENAYKQLLAQKSLTDKMVRSDIAQGLMARQLLVPASFGATFPQSAAVRYASLLKERREGALAYIPALAFAPKEPASDQQLGAFYKANGARYMVPERRTIRYAVFDETAIKDVPAPTEAEIQQRYKLNAAVYAPSETRDVTQVILTDEASAKALAAEVAAGKPIDAAARARGLSTSKLPGLTPATLASQASKAVADAVFATAQGKVAAPARSGIGWHVIRVDAITRKPGKTLDQARPELVAALTAEKRKTALGDVSAKIEQQFESGTGLADAVKSLGLAVQTSEPLQADGTIFGKPGVKPIPEVAGLVQTAFAMEREGQPQLAEAQQGTRFVIFDVARIEPAAPAPLAQIRERVQRDWAIDAGTAKAKAASDGILAALKKDTSLADALKATGAALPAPNPIAMSREQLNGMQPRIPEALGLMFAMAQGTAKRLQAPDKSGWIVVSLAKVIPGVVQPNDPIVPAAARELGTALGREYAEALRAAIRNDIGVKRNEAGLRAVRTQLVGGQ
ncbi:SurA N-terminal domain-containing protein [Novosphingobium sp. KCTC 2891]|uniref:peptidylprolyl isomerase n=1 Tax=Novosphingobium sp. KCTC 2891 TaxID=2989730 RepID=UPI0022234907|nr:peptidylprolyl isomerase [Novosphingobium sp. KCTC 2891]MCW1384388.1 SurA N-terminal domain-containing protein [Novosphingobium sp. KCTC 2891]